jgi:hypothetical protein
MSPRRLSPEERIIAASKHLDLSMEQIREGMDRNGGALKHPLVAPRLRGQLRLAIRCRSNSPTAWSMSVILYSRRFDGRVACIDWEGSFVAIDGRKSSGFHRHVWDAMEMSCERPKLPLPDFRPATAEEFILGGFALLAITYKKSSSGGFIQ